MLETSTSPSELGDGVRMRAANGFLFIAAGGSFGVFDTFSKSYVLIHAFHPDNKSWSYGGFAYFEQHSAGARKL